jgi:DNA repair photolyase
VKQESFQRMRQTQGTYKHAISVTGQIFFCAAPIRLDSYDTCQFGCTYCFSRDRARTWAAKGIHQANPVAFRKRMERVAQGEIASAVDEFLARRVPLQLGGLQDPFTPIEEELGVTLDILKTLRDFRYPTLISTKGSLLLSEPYLKLLCEMNVVVRLSAAGIPDRLRKIVEPRGDGFDATIDRLARLSANGITTGLRIQPIFPGFEEEALAMATTAAKAGAKQLSFEFLKIPGETVGTEIAAASTALGYDIVEHMRAKGVTRLGPDWSLSPNAKRPFVRQARHLCRSLDVKFGAGDTEFIPWSDGNGCCGASELTQDGANHFTANFVGAIRASLAKPDRKVRFETLLKLWSPEQSIGNYMDWRRRIPLEERGGFTDWLAIVGRRWNGGKSPYSPAFFDGVVKTTEFDDDGFRIYDASALARELAV